jgi:hypothetical protein
MMVEIVIDCEHVAIGDTLLFDDYLAYMVTGIMGDRVIAIPFDYSQLSLEIH